MYCFGVCIHSKRVGAKKYPMKAMAMPKMTLRIIALSMAL